MRISSRLFGLLAFTAIASPVAAFAQTPAARPSPANAGGDTVDARLSYATPKTAPIYVRELTATLSVQNLFDRDPPFVDNPSGDGFDPQIASAEGRVVSIQLAKRF